MQSITIYDSEGNEYGTQRTGRADQRIQDFFFAGLKLAVDIRGEPEVVCFFRARESDTGRSEQFYAVYQTGSQRNLFSNFKNDLERTIDQYGLTLVTDTDDTQFYHELDQESGTPPGDDIQRTVLAEGGGRGQPMRVGVGTTRDAFSLAKSFLKDREIKSIAIADQTTGSVFKDYDLSIEIGQYRGIQPLGDTQAYLDEVRDSIEGRLVSDRIDNIKSEVQTLRSKTSLSGSEIRTRLKQDLSVLDPPAYEMASNNTSSAGGSDRKKQLIAVVGAIGVVLAVVAGVSLYFGIIPFGDSGDSGDSGTSGSIEQVRINGTNVTDTNVVRVNVTADEPIPVNVEHSADSIEVSLNGSQINDTTENESSYFGELEPSEYEEGNNTLRIEAGDDSKNYTIIINTTGENSTGDSNQDPGNETEQLSLSVETPSANASIQNSSFNVSGTTNANIVTVMFRNNENGNISYNSTATVGNNGSFSVEYTVPENISAGNYDVIINVTRGEEFNSTTVNNVTVAPQDGTTAGATILRPVPPQLVQPAARAH